MIHLDQIQIDNHLPLTLFGGLNVLESRDLAMQVAEAFCQASQKLGMPYVFKASFDKANRSSIHSFRGHGIDQGLKWLQEIKQTFHVPILTDIHEPHQAESVATVADVLQIPAFLSRQTDLIAAAASTGRILNIKKAQFLAPQEMRHILQKIKECGGSQVMLCERGSCFGYNNLVVDMLAFPVLKDLNVPVLFDTTHALQLPGGLSQSAGGRSEHVLALASSAVAQGLAGLFIEAHPDPTQALCDGPCALKLDELPAFLERVVALDQLVKSFSSLPSLHLASIV